ncbi:MAG: hypothetical protein CMK89_22180 [Pseudomonadales bacterium]|nr:hypothetical protein [Pseudomonadales bacterium]
MNTTVQIKRRFCGPPESGNGGYVCGLIGEALADTATVRLFLPPPLEKDLTLQLVDGEAQLLDGEKLVGKGWVEALDVQCPPIPSFDEAVEAAGYCSGFEQHPFPGCFVCGPDRANGDGLRIFPGHLMDSKVVAAPWVPDASLKTEAGNGVIDPVFIWSALDCTSAFPMLPAGEGKALVLGQMGVHIIGEVKVDERCVMLGWPIKQEGKKHFSASAVIGEDGSVVAMAKATWIEVAAASFQS